MATNVDFSLGKNEDAVLTISLAPATPIGGWKIRWLAQKRFGGLSGFAVKWCDSGYANGQSGITFINSGLGQFQVAINAADTSGLDFGNFATACERLDSGSRTILTAGYLLLMPSVTP